jgi:hypothetical protein
VLHHKESQRRQYGLGDRARELGFQQVEVIDGDLGLTGSRLVERPGPASGCRSMQRRSGCGLLY